MPVVLYFLEVLLRQAFVFGVLWHGVLELVGFWVPVDTLLLSVLAKAKEILYARNVFLHIIELLKLFNLPQRELLNVDRLEGLGLKDLLVDFIGQL